MDRPAAPRVQPIPPDMLRTMPRATRLVLPILLAVASIAVAQEGNPRAEALARNAPQGSAALAFIQGQVKQIRDPALRTAAAELLASPRPAFMARYPSPAQREAARAELVKQGLLAASVPAGELFPPLPEGSAAPMSFLAAPGGTLDSHHAYPGGLAEHTAFNLQLALDLLADYAARYHLRGLDRDQVVAAVVLHDVLKPWCLQWKADGTVTVEPSIGGTWSHHIFAIAEALHRGLPPEFVVSLASAHESPGLAPDRVVAFLRAAAILAGVDPVERGILRKTDQGFALARLPSIEASIHHLSDHDYVVTIPADKAIAGALHALMVASPQGKALDAAELRWQAHRIQTQVSGLVLYQALRERGPEGIAALLRDAHVPLVVAPDGLQ